MHPPVPDERPDSATRAAYAAIVTAIAQLLVTAGGVALGTWTADNEDGADTAAGGGIIVGWGLISAGLLIVAALLTLRRRHGGRVMFYVFGILALLNHLLCGVYNGIVGAEIERLSGKGTPAPPMWMAALGMTGAVLGIAAAIAGLVYYGRKTTRHWLKPPPPPVVYVPVPPRW